KLNIDVQMGGAEAESAILGALTTPGTTRPLAKGESLFDLCHEDGSVQFFATPLPPAVFARVCVVKADEL
ncbi:diol dehydratase reactivase ATPase-like domain-containing protein, partial [Salmonella enterica]|uniref:diol dehydratase reactivase ATPase-like domain-containing protein n=1 Tax=Salmonella enterica TaxID=28901 RepID=UPI0032968ACE